jgi:hypothetical protein
MGRHGPCRAARTDQAACLTETARHLADAVGELQAANAKLQEFDSTVAATTLRPELSRLKRHLDVLAETLRIPQRAEAITRPNRYRFGPRRVFARVPPVTVCHFAISA